MVIIYPLPIYNSCPNDTGIQSFPGFNTKITRWCIYVTVNCGNQALPGMPEIFRQYTVFLSMRTAMQPGHSDRSRVALSGEFD